MQKLLKIDNPTKEILARTFRYDEMIMHAVTAERSEVQPARTTWEKAPQGARVQYRMLSGRFLPNGHIEYTNVQLAAGDD
jgi:hypothetical protein